MKNPINRTFLVLLAASTVALWSVQSSSAMAIATFEWRFDTSANPTAPEVSAGGAAQGAVAPGQYASGWMSANTILGSAQGIWDLGRLGTITLSNPSGLAGPSGQERLFTVRISQYQDGSIYNQFATLSIPGATLVSSSSSTESIADIGDWIVAETQWKAAADASINSIVVTSAYNGSLINRVTVESGAALAQQPQLTIRTIAGGKVEISWPASYTGWKLESNSSTSDAGGWADVGEPVQDSGSLHYVQTDAGASARFYRLKQP